MSRVTSVIHEHIQQVHRVEIVTLTHGGEKKKKKEKKKIHNKNAGPPGKLK